MARTFYFGNVAKRKNSTLQGTITNAFDVLFKNPCSLDSPILTLNYSGDFDYNVAKYVTSTTPAKTYYYFVVDKKSLHNNLWEVALELDVLATYKSEILASTQFVSYSASTSLDQYLVDNRIPVRTNAAVSVSSPSSIALLDTTGRYILSCVGQTGSAIYDCSKTNIDDVLASVNTWESAGITAAQGIIQSFTGSTSDFGDAISNLNDTLATIGKALIECGFVGNAYAQAPQCIRSCIWVPFNTVVHDTGNVRIYLGNFDTHVDSHGQVKTTPMTGDTTITIPWQLTGWARAKCEDVYLYLPFVGIVNIPSNEIVGNTQIRIEWSATATDGVICYEVKAGNQIIGTYGGQCCANYPIGINQQASAGEIVNSIMAGSEKMITTGVEAASSVNPAAWVVGGTALTMQATNTAWDVINLANTTHATSVGGIGGGAGAGLGLSAICYTVAHMPNITISATDPAFIAYKAAMGIPYMKTTALTALTGFTQCVNAHVAADADSPILNSIDTFLNNGFYIE